MPIIRDDRDRLDRERRRSILRRIDRLVVDPAYIAGSYEPEIDALARNPSPLDSPWAVLLTIIGALIAGTTVCWVIHMMATA